MNPQIIFSPSHIAQRVGVDRRSILRRLEKHGIAPDFITVAGEPFYSATTVDKICQEDFYETISAPTRESREPHAENIEAS